MSEDIFLFKSLLYFTSEVCVTDLAIFNISVRKIIKKELYPIIVEPGAQPIGNWASQHVISNKNIKRQLCEIDIPIA